MENKRYFWLKLHEDFFSSKRIKKLRKLAGGDTFTIIYLKMQLKSLKSDGVLEYTGIEDSFAKELALDIDEDADNVAITVNYLLTVGLLETSDDLYKMPYVSMCTGGETAVAERVRNHRKRTKALQCNTNVTQVKQIETQEKQLGNVDIEIEKEIDIDIEKDNTLTEIDFAELRELEKFNEELEKKNTKSSKFIPPTLEQVKAYAESRNRLDIAERFFDYYQAGEWKDVKGNKIKNWKQKFVTWESRNEVKTPKAYSTDKMKSESTDISKLRGALFGED